MKADSVVLWEHLQVRDFLDSIVKFIAKTSENNAAKFSSTPDVESSLLLETTSAPSTVKVGTIETFKCEKSCCIRCQDAAEKSNFSYRIIKFQV